MSACRVLGASRCHGFSVRRMQAWFPGCKPPLPMQLHVEVDGQLQPQAYSGRVAAADAFHRHKITGPGFHAALLGKYLRGWRPAPGGSGLVAVTATAPCSKLVQVGCCW